MRRRKPAEVFVEAALSQSNDPRNIAAGDDCGALIARRRGLLCRNRTGVGAAAAESGRPTHAIGRLDLGSATADTSSYHRRSNELQD